TAAALRHRQLERLNAVLQHARETVPFYRDRIRDAPLASLAELAQLPLLRKAQVRAAGREITSRLGPEGPACEVHTGGTTGTPLTVHCDRPTLKRNYAFFARFLEQAGVPACGRAATFAGRIIVAPGRTAPPYWRYNLA